MKSSSIEILMILRFDGSEVKIRVRISQISAGFSWRWSSEMMVIYGDGDSVELPSTINYHKLPLLKRKPSRCGPGQFRGYLFPFDLWSFTQRVLGEITTQAKPSFAALDI